LALPKMGLLYCPSFSKHWLTALPFLVRRFHLGKPRATTGMRVSR